MSRVCHGHQGSKKGGGKREGHTMAGRRGAGGLESPVLLPPFVMRVLGISYLISNMEQMPLAFVS